MDPETDITRKLRCKERKHYDDGSEQDDEIEGKRTFNLEEKLQSNKYNSRLVCYLQKEDFSLKYFQEIGFKTPLLFKKTEEPGLGMKIPNKDFKVGDVKHYVGSRRVVDVVDVNTQKGIEMNMAQWVRYFEDPNREKLYNVISLEFSHTKLEDFITSPSVVRQIDWVDTVWPQHLKITQTESTNVISEMKYPKVQKYCLMSVKGCYTDFHIDFGGTSVWYHLLHGKKIFWLIPPTEENLLLYENWVLSGKQGDIFLGDKVKKCDMITLEEGDTFFIPTGWIHAVYTPSDSLVFGGNFLHSFNIELQLRISEIEERTRVPLKFRYPFFGEINWYVLDRYVNILMKKIHYQIPEEDYQEILVDDFSEMLDNNCLNEDYFTGDNSQKITKIFNSLQTRSRSNSKSSSSDSRPQTPHSRDTSPLMIIPHEENCLSVDDDCKYFEEENDKSISHVHLTRYEIIGLTFLINWLESLPASKKNVPKGISNPDILIMDAKEMIKEHENDDSILAITNRSVIKWPSIISKPKIKQKSNKTYVNITKKSKTSSGSVRRRRTRCRKCENCQRNDCGDCHFCKDMKKFGGPGRMKQSCLQRQCLLPVLPNTVSCNICGGDDHDFRQRENSISLMECMVCFEVVHPKCLKEQGFENDGIINEDLSNSWECPKCFDNDNEIWSNNEDEEENKKVPSDSFLLKRKKETENPMSPKKKIKIESESLDCATSHFLNKDSFQPWNNFSEDFDGINNSKKKKKEVTNHIYSQESLNKDVFPSHGYKDLSKQKILSKKLKEVRKKMSHIPDKDGNLKFLTDAGIIALHKPNYSKNSKIIPGKYQQHWYPGQSSQQYHSKMLKRIKVFRSRPRKPPLLTSPKPVEMERHVVRPKSISPPPDCLYLNNDSFHVLKREIWMSIFNFLTQKDLCICMRVCKTLNRWCCDQRLWNKIDMSKIAPITPAAMSGIIRRQPINLDLSWSNISRKQINWLINRLPGLKHIYLNGCSWTTVSALCTINCPLLESLSLQWVEGIKDSTFADLISPPLDHRPGCTDNKSRMRYLIQLKLTGCDITDESMTLLVHHVPFLRKLDISHCTALTDNAIECLCTSSLSKTLTDINLTGCIQLTQKSLEYLRKGKILSKIIFSKYSSVNEDSTKFYSTNDKVT